MFKHGIHLRIQDLWIASCYAKPKDFDNARKYYIKAINLDPKTAIGRDRYETCIGISLNVTNLLQETIDQMRRDLMKKLNLVC